MSKAGGEKRVIRRPERPVAGSGDPLVVGLIYFASFIIFIHRFSAVSRTIGVRRDFSPIELDSKRAE